MKILFYTLLIYSLFVQNVQPTRKNLKPSFYPYCRSKETCIPSCNCEISPRCILLTMDESIRSSILYYHNQIRDIQCGFEPKPAGMTQLEYDMELEEISMCWAGRCEEIYSDCFVTYRFSETSQSVIQVVLDEGQKPNVFLWMQVMNEWLGKVRTLTKENIHRLPFGEEEEMIHNYVQVISDRVLAIGCAWSSLNNVLTLVCTYGPRGSRSGEPVYNIGYPCSLCPGGYVCDFAKPFEHLCKLKIYSADPSMQDQMMNYTLPPLPPLPASEYSKEDAEYHRGLLKNVLPPPPLIPELLRGSNRSSSLREYPSAVTPPKLPFHPGAPETFPEPVTPPKPPFHPAAPDIFPVPIPTEATTQKITEESATEEIAERSGLRSLSMRTQTFNSFLVLLYPTFKFLTSFQNSISL